MSIAKWLLVIFSLFLFRIRSILDIARSAGVHVASTAKYLALRAARLSIVPSNVVQCYWPEDY